MNLESMVGRGEEILWKGTPDKKCFILKILAYALIPFVVILFGFLFSSIITGDSFFITICLVCVCVLLIIAISTAFLSYRNVEYIITNKAIYMSMGIFSVHYKSKPFAEMSHVDVHRGVFDQWFGAGAVVLTTPPSYMKIDSIHDYEQVYNLAKKLQEDIYADTQFPNEYRPEENHGYNTKYDGKGKI